MSQIVKLPKLNQKPVVKSGPKCAIMSFNESLGPQLRINKVGDSEDQEEQELIRQI